jgi:site-specific DNA recombinase
VNAMLGPQNTGSTCRHERSNALLRGLLYCQACQCLMTPTTTRKHSREYRYYVCLQAQKQGWATCPSKSLPAHRIEAAVWQQLREHGLATEENRQALEQLVEHIDYDGRNGRVSVRLRARIAVATE